MSETKQFTSLRDKIRAESAERRAEYAKLEELWQRALEAGRAAGAAHIPRPMGVRDERTGDTWAIPDGACGFAWVVCDEGTSRLARWATKHKKARREYGGGTCLYWVGEFNQSMERKEAFARAFADVFRQAGYQVHARSRMD